MQSAIFTGQVYHKRFEPVEHTLSYRTFYLLLDLDECAELNTISSLFGYNKRAWLSFWEQDFGLKNSAQVGDARRALKNQFSTMLADNGMRARHWSFQILTMPRILGYAFNPISLIYCRDETGQLAAMIYEVNNTFDERIHYVLPVKDYDTRIKHNCAKEMFVSPFSDMQGSYAFDVGLPRDRLSYAIDYNVEGNLKLRASFSGQRFAFDPVNLRRLALKRSGTAIKVIAGIHWEAVKLWWKGLPIVNHVPLVNQDVEDFVKTKINPQSNETRAGYANKMTYARQNTTTRLESESQK